MIKTSVLTNSVTELAKKDLNFVSGGVNPFMKYPIYAKFGITAVAASVSIGLTGIPCATALAALSASAISAYAAKYNLPRWSLVEEIASSTARFSVNAFIGIVSAKTLGIDPRNYIPKILNGTNATNT
jgi:hypothetical protein